MTFDPKLDLLIKRFVDVPLDLMWTAWTEPEHVKRWFTPAPWTTVDCEIDLRPGGIFRTTMRSPEGEEHPNFGAFLEIVPERKLVWTDALEAGFRPSRHPAHLGFRFTAVIQFEPRGEGTHYTALVMHDDEASKTKHEEMGFFDGWGSATDQLVEHARTLRR
jgi:uncharacterized protein YndB with AHSA1/START domain